MTSLAQARDAANAKVARLSDGDTAFHLQGDRGPWVILVHGLVTPSYGWEPLAKALAQQGFRTLRYDHFGRGLSDRPSIRYNLDLYIRQLRELADNLSIESMHLVGWSMGGTIITRFAAEQPSRTDSLTLIAPGLYLRQPFIAKVLSRVPPARKIAAWRVRDVIDRLEKEHLSRPGRFPRYNERAREQLAFPGMGESFASTVANFAWDAGDEWSVVGEHPRAVLLVWGSADTVTPYRNAEKVMRLYPRATLLTVDAAKHAPHLDHPGFVNPAVIEHLRSAERS